MQETWGLQSFMMHAEVVKAIREKDFAKAKEFLPVAVAAGEEIEAFVSQLA